MSEKISFKVFSYLILLFFTFSFLIRSDSSFDQDLGRHLKLGEIILKEGFVPQTNLFSYTQTNFPFINHHFLSEVLLFLGKKVAGELGLLIFKILIILLNVFFILKISMKKNYFLVLPLGYLFLHVLRERTDLRPEIFSFFFVSLTYLILNFFDLKKTKWIWVLPIIQLIWVNTHIYFLLGFLLQGIFLIHFLFTKNFSKTKLLLWVIIFSLLVSLINPNFIKGFFYPFHVFENYGYTIAENQNMFLLENVGFSDSNFLFVKLAVLFSLLSIFWALFQHQLLLKNFLLTLLGISLALTNIRSFPYLLFISFPAVAENLSGVFRKHSSFLIAGLSLILLIFESNMYLNGSYYQYSRSPQQANLILEEHGKKALDFVLDRHLPQPIYNNFDIGSYIIYRAYPSYHVFVDGRPEAYPKEFFQENYIRPQEDETKFQSLDNQFNFQTIIFSHTDQTPWGRKFLSSIIHNPKWKIVFLDDFMIVLVKNEVASQNHLQTIDLAKLLPSQYNFDFDVPYLRLASFLSNEGYQKEAFLFSQKIIPGRGWIWW